MNERIQPNKIKRPKAERSSCDWHHVINTSEHHRITVRLRRAQVSAGICESSSEMAGNFDCIQSPLGVEGGLSDSVGEEWIRKEGGRGEFMQEAALVIRVPSDGG